MNKNYTASGHYLKHTCNQTTTTSSSSALFHFTLPLLLVLQTCDYQHNIQPPKPIPLPTQPHLHVSPFFWFLKQVLILATKHATLSELSKKIEINRSGPNEALAKIKSCVIFFSWLITYTCAQGVFNSQLHIPHNLYVQECVSIELQLIG